METGVLEAESEGFWMNRARVGVPEVQQCGNWHNANAMVATVQ